MESKSNRSSDTKSKSRISKSTSTIRKSKTTGASSKSKSRQSVNASKSRQSVNASKSRQSVNSSKARTSFYEDDDLGDREKRLTQVTSKAISRFDRKKKSRFAKLAKGTASTVLSAYLGFKDPKKRRREYLIPKDKAAWLEWLVIVAKRRINVEYLTDKELRKVIIRARPNLSPHKKTQESVEDHDLPPCMEWNEKQVGDWISSIGYPYLRETFVKNFITGRRLVLIDCSALNKMGMTDLTAMRDVAGKIRELLGVPPPNAMRPIMRVAPFERFLRRKVYNGRTYDDLTFEKYCEKEGFNYDIISENKNAQIPCTCEVLITTPDNAEDQDSDGEDEDEDHSLKNAPTVEYLCRNAIIRNKTVNQIINDILENVFLPPKERKYGKEVWGSLKRGIGEGYDDLHLYYAKDKLEFASGVAHSLIDELYKTVGIMNDISQLEKHIQDDMSPEDMAIFQEAAKALMEEAVPIASLLALGELDLETIFRDEPTFREFVNEVVQEAERKTNELVPDALSFVTEICTTALTHLLRDAAAGKNKQKITEALKGLKIEDTESQRSLGIKISVPDLAPSSKPSRKTNFQDESIPDAEKPKTDAKTDEQHQQRPSLKPTQGEKQAPRSNLASATGTEAEKKTRAKSVVMSPLPKGAGAAKETGKNKPPVHATKTPMKKDQHVTK